MLDSIKPGLYIALGIVVVLMWNAWQEEHPRTQAAATHTSAIKEHHNVDVPDIKVDSHKTPEVMAVPEKTSRLEAVNYINVETDVISAKINPTGGSLDQVVLKKYPISLEQQDQFIHLLNHSETKTYVAQSGIAGGMGPDTRKGPVVYQVTQTNHTLSSGQDVLEVNLNWENERGLQLTKTYVFHRGQYLVDVKHELTNNTGETWRGSFYAQIKRDSQTEKKTGLFSFPTYTGAAISSPEKRFEKISFDEMEETPVKREVKGGWISMVQHYFVSAWIPDEKSVYKFSSVASSDEDLYRIRMVGPTLHANPGETVTTKSRFYAGPEITSDLKDIAPGLELTVDYGMFWPISQGLFWLLKKLHHLLGNWGLAIIGVTILIKLAFYRLSASSYRSMANMRRIQPKLTALKQRYGEDRQKMSQAMMDLYKKEKINPLGGCLPVLIQIPVFIALYWVLIESVELRQAPFYFWIHDLSVKDPYYVLPLIMGASMFLQQKLSPTPPDPIQAKVMMLMPVMFTLLFLSFPAGLLLYWVANNGISILQQWYITKKEEEASSKKK